jgi:hypothetical protein
MANPDSVSQYYLDSFGNGRIGYAPQANLATTGSGVITIPLLSGGLTVGATAGSSGSVILRRITVNNPQGSVSSANVSITTSSDGNISNAVVANVVLSNLTTSGKYQDLTIAGAYGANTAVSGATTQALYVNINTASGNSNLVNIVIYGDVVSF